MDLTYQIRLWKDKRIKPFTILLAWLHIPPYFFSLAGLFSGILAAAYVFKQSTLFFTFVIFHIICDSLDGSIARYTKNFKTAWLDKYFVDQIVFASILIGVYVQTRDQLIIAGGIAYGIAHVYNSFNMRKNILVRPEIPMYLLLFFNQPVFVAQALFFIGILNLCIVFFSHKLPWFNTLFQRSEE